MGLTIETNNFAFEVKVNFGLNYTFPGGWVVGWVGGWLEKMKIEQSSASAGLKLAELCKKYKLKSKKKKVKSRN